jgi:hypothetical protein
MKKSPSSVLYSATDYCGGMSYYFNAQIALMPSEYYEISVKGEKYLVVGCFTKCVKGKVVPLTNKPVGLMCRKINKFGYPTKQLLIHKFSDDDTGLTTVQFWDKFPNLSVYAVYSDMQYRIAADNIEQFRINGNSVLLAAVSRAMADNEHFSNLWGSDNIKVDAHGFHSNKLNTMKLFSEHFKNDKLQAVIDSLRVDAPPQVSIDELVQLRLLDHEMYELQKAFYTASITDSIYSEYEDYQGLEVDFGCLKQFHHHVLPKDKSGNVVIY